MHTTFPRPTVSSKAAGQSLEVATHQGARLFALRSARDLAAILVEGGDEEAAAGTLRAQLAGLDTQSSPELVAARAALEALDPS